MKFNFYMKEVLGYLEIVIIILFLVVICVLELNVWVEMLLGNRMFVIVLCLCDNGGVCVLFCLLGFFL